MLGRTSGAGRGAADASPLTYGGDSFVDYRIGLDVRFWGIRL